MTGRATGPKDVAGAPGTWRAETTFSVPDTRLVEPHSDGIFDQPSTLVFPAVVSGFALLALAAPLGDAEEPLHRVGALLAIAGLLQILHGVRRADLGALRRAVGGGVLSTLMGLLVLSTPSSSIPAVVL